MAKHVTVPRFAWVCTFKSLILREKFGKYYSSPPDINVRTDGFDVLHRIEKSADTTLEYLVDLKLKYHLYVLSSVGETSLYMYVVKIQSRCLKPSQFCTFVNKNVVNSCWVFLVAGYSVGISPKIVISKIEFVFLGSERIHPSCLSDRG